MNRLLILFLLVSILFSASSPAQQEQSIQFSGGIITPLSSSDGLNATVQYNYSLNNIFDLYLSAGYSTWDKFFINYESSDRNRTEFKKTYSEDEHIIVPVSLGSRLTFNTTKLFSTFVDLEIGYSYLVYNSYVVRKSVNPDTGEFIEYFPDRSTRQQKAKHLLNVGVGAGLSHPMTKNVSLVFTFKLNSFANSSYSGLFSTNGTYTMVSAGFDFKI